MSQILCHIIFYLQTYVNTIVVIEAGKSSLL